MFSVSAIDICSAYAIMLKMANNYTPKRAFELYQPRYAFDAYRDASADELRANGLKIAGLGVAGVALIILTGVGLRAANNLPLVEFGEPGQAQVYDSHDDLGR